MSLLNGYAEAMDALNRRLRADEPNKNNRRNIWWFRKFFVPLQCLNDCAVQDDAATDGGICCICHSKNNTH